MIRVLKVFYLLINIAVIVSLLILHFYIKDSTYDASLFFYLFPLPIIILIILGLSIFLGKRRKYNLLLAGLLLVVWLGRSFRISLPPNIEESDLEIVFWNASRDEGFEEAFKAHGSIPDVLILTESNDDSLDYLKSKYSTFHFYNSSEELQIFSREPIHVSDELNSNFGSTVIPFETYGMNFYAVDMTGSTDVPKAWEFKFFNSIHKRKENTIILGDFNIPCESIFLDELKENYIHFFASKGNGFRETWFWNIPFLSIDQIWVSKDLKIVKSEKIRTSNSDHSMVKTVVRQ